MIRKGLCLVLFVLAGMYAAAQRGAYPLHYFSNPLGGAWNTVLLAGNFGECRPGHFHSGLDIKTAGVENKPVYAAADGYVSRISMQSGGFGHALYITHPNGYTTLYAHLNDFAPAIQAWVRSKQYAAESWRMDEKFLPEKFPVKKDELIAYSGNTGGSTAPHLHFEIRNTATEHPLNPQLFGCTVKDTKQPVIYSISLYDAKRSIYDELPQTIKVSDMNGVYRPAKDTLRSLSEDLGIGITTDDFMDGSGNTLAFYKAELYLDDKLQQTITLDDIGYDETRYLNAFADYRIKHNNGPWVQLLYRLPGNKLSSIYSAKDGILHLPLMQPQTLRIVITDANGNASTVETRLIAEAGAGPMVCARKTAINTSAVRFRIPPEAIYDAVCLDDPFPVKDAAAMSPGVMVGDAAVPLHSAFILSLKADKAIPFAQRNKMALVCRDGTGEEGKVAVPEAGGWYTANVRSFGEYRLVADIRGPVIKAATLPARWKSEIRFTVKDAITSVKSFRGELDGKWILFEQHGSSWFYKMDEHCLPGKHTLIVTATDEPGNAATQRFTFTKR